MGPYNAAHLVRNAAVAAIMITGCSAFTQSAGGAEPEVSVPAGQDHRFDPNCPYIARVCAVIADPAVRNYIGLSDYAWDFNAPTDVLSPAPVSAHAPDRDELRSVAALLTPPAIETPVLHRSPAVAASDQVPLAFGYLEFDWDSRAPVPGFDTWPAADATRR